MYDYIYDNEQDAIIDFVMLLNINLNYLDINNDDVLVNYNRSSFVLDSSKLNQNLVNQIMVEDDDNLFMALLFLVKTNMPHCILEINKKD